MQSKRCWAQMADSINCLLVAFQYHHKRVGNLLYLILWHMCAIAHVGAA